MILMGLILALAIGTALFMETNKRQSNNGTMVNLTLSYLLPIMVYLSVFGVIYISGRF